MPIYEYQCTSCAYRFEVKQSIKDDPIKECARCGKDVTKLISPPAIMFKGSGWYITDYSDKMKPGGSDTSEKPAAAGTDKATTSTASESTTSTPAAAPAVATTTATGPATSTASTAASNSSSTSSSSS